MQTSTNSGIHQLKQDIDRAMNDLEQVAGEVGLKVHLVGLEVKQLWSTKLEPSLFEARVHAKEATASSKAAIESTLKAFREFAQIL